MAGRLEAAVQSIKFSCPGCGQHLQANVDAEGMEIECPGCSKKVSIPKHGEARLSAQCPRCLQKLKLPVESAGTQIQCPSCSLTFEAPKPPEPKPRKKLFENIHLPKWFIPAAVGAVLVVIFGIYWNWRQSPAYSLNLIATSIREHDFVTFQKFVDIESVTTRFIDDITALGVIEAEDKDNATVGVGLVQLLKPRLIDEARKQLHRFVESGNFGETNRAFAPLMVLRRADGFLGIVKQAREGKVVVLGLGFTNQQEGFHRTVEIKMRRVESHWQMAELSNVSELVQQEKIENTTRLARKNAPTEAAIGKILKVEEISKESNLQERTVDKKATLKMRVMNNNKIPVLGYSAVIKLTFGANKKTRELRVRSSDRIAPGAVDSGIWEYTINQFSVDDSLLYKGQVTAFEVRFLRVQLEGWPELVIEE